MTRVKTVVTTVTERGQVSIPAAVRKRLNLTPGQRVTWEPISDHECRMRVLHPPLPTDVARASCPCFMGGTPMPRGVLQAPRMKVAPERPMPGAKAMLGYAAKFRRVRRTSEWMDEIRQGEIE